MTESFPKTRAVGRPRKNGRRVSAWIPAELAAAVNDWGQQYTTQTDRLEAALEIGLAAAPRGAYGPVDASYSGDTEYVTVNLPPQLARRVLRPVSAKKVSITRRLFTLLHFAMQAEGQSTGAARTSPAPVQLTLTGTGG